MSRKIALVRVDYNVPIKNGQILDLTRIKASLPTINYLLEKNLSIILISHLGRPSSPDPQYSLKILIEPLERLLNEKISFIQNLGRHRILKNRVGLLENLRFFEGEKTNDPNFCQELSQLGDVYVNDAFGVSHREHASTSGIHDFFPKQKYRGLLLDLELHQLQKLKNNAPPPYTIIVGGSKIGSKIHMLEAFLNIADNILIGGGMAFPFIKHLGGAIGRSICEDNELDVVKSFLKKAQKSTTKILLPKDCIIARSVEEINTKKTADIMSIPSEFMGLDIGPKTIKLFNRVTLNSRSIMWNGPMGVSEIDEFSQGTRALAESITISTSKGGYSLIGGGDTVSDINRLGFKNNFSYVSTGGGAMLEFFKNEQLPGIRDLQKIK